MGRIREDLIGVVTVDGVHLFAGDEVPEGVVVGDHVLEPVSEGKPEPKPVSDVHTEAELAEVKTSRRRGRPSKSEE